MPIYDLKDISYHALDAAASRSLMNAQAGLANANAQEQEFKNQQTAKMEELNQLASQRLKRVLGREPSDTLGDPAAVAEKMTSLAQPLEAIAGIYLQGGGVETGVDLLKSASEIRKRESDIETAETTDQQNKLENIVKGVDIFSRVMGSAKSPDEWELGKRELRRFRDNGAFDMDDETLNSILELPYDPDATAFLNDRAISAADKARMEMQAIDDARQDKANADTNTDRRIRIQMQRARDAETRRHHQVIEKASGSKGGAANAPTDVEIKQARGALVNSVYKGLNTKDNPDVAEAATYVANQAKALVKANKGLTMDQAVQQAIARGQLAGVFGRVETDNVSTFLGREVDREPSKRDPKFTRTGKTPEAAMRPPINSAGKVDPSKLQKGRYYTLADGSVGKFDGSGFVID